MGQDILILHLYSVCTLYNTATMLGKWCVLVAVLGIAGAVPFGSGWNNGYSGYGYSGYGYSGYGYSGSWPSGSWSSGSASYSGSGSATWGSGFGHGSGSVTWGSGSASYHSG